MDAISRSLSRVADRAASLQSFSSLAEQAEQDLERALELARGDPASLQSELVRISTTLKTGQTRAQDSHKEWHGALNKLGKEIDKTFNADLSPLLPMPPPASTGKGKQAEVVDPFAHMYFADEKSARLLDSAIAMHFVREGNAELADQFVQEAGVDFPDETRKQFAEMHAVLAAIRQNDLEPALDWAAANRPALQARDSPLEFHLHRSRFVRLLLSDSIPLPASFPLYNLSGQADPAASRPTMNGASDSIMQEDEPSQPMGKHLAYAYARAHFSPFYATHGVEIGRLLASALFLPLERILRSPYADVFHPYYTPATFFDSPDSVEPSEVPRSRPAPTDPEELHAAHLVPLFSSEFCANLKMSRDLPLKVATDIGGGGALAKLAKVRSVMKEKRTEWSSKNELPVEIPLPPAYRFHSVFTCPVSKEQATEDNPPVMMICGHVIAKDSLTRLSKGGNNVKCPYCPVQSNPSSAIRLYF